MAEELRPQLWREYPLAEIRRQHDLRDTLSIEFDELLAWSPADRPIGRPATLRAAITAHDAWLKKADGRLRKIDVDVLRGEVVAVQCCLGTAPPHETRQDFATRLVPEPEGSRCADMVAALCLRATVEP